MNRFKRPVLWAALIVILLLVCFSVYGAFLGADRAQVFFNSVPLTAYWFALAALLIAGIALFRRLIHVPSLLLMHLGCILILAGGMWGSAGGQALQARLLGRERIVKGQMPIREGATENHVRIGDSNDMPELPFSIRLRDFRIEYYQPGTLMMQSRSGQNWRMPAEAGATLSLGRELGKVTIQQTFENFRMDISGDERVAFDAPGGYNPALQVVREKPDGSTTQRYVFLQQAGHVNPNVDLMMVFNRAIRDYTSELEVVEEGRVVKQKDIEVNHPLYYGGYHFYQSSYGQNDLGEYTVLTVVSDSGLKAVFAGYAMLVGGVCWHFWFRRLRTATGGGQKTQNGKQNTDQGGGGHGH
ncbi:MAG: cytochrome c biogenesis protein ResB [Phycisphaerales bacterium]|nr:MAG: cytochrome c biogenesis protein ResB [Phycisphaerales bacterium]